MLKPSTGAAHNKDVAKDVYCVRCYDELDGMSGAWHDQLSRLCRECHSTRIPWLGGTSCTTYFSELRVGIPADTMENFRKLQPSLPSKEYPMLLNSLSHAKLYVLADMYLMDELKQLTLRRLHQDLTRMAVTEANRRYIKL